jgi:hypothetical protein
MAVDQTLIRAWAASLILMLPGGGRAQVAPAAPPIDTELRLPGIRSFMKRPEDPPMPPITLEALSQCMGEDVTLRTQVLGLMTRRDELTRQRAPLEAEQLGFQQAGAQIDARRQTLDQQNVAHQRSRRWTAVARR